MRLAYLSGSRIPSRKANSIQVMKMCEAFATAGHAVTLYAKQGDEGGADPHAWYGTTPSFEIDFTDKTTGRFAASLRYALAVRRKVAGGRLPDALYGRHAQSLAATAALGVPFGFEAHQLPPPGMERRLQAWLLRRPNARKLVVISGALKRDYREIFPWLADDRIVIAHSGSSPIPEGARPSAMGWQRRPGAAQVGYVGHLYPGRGVEIILELARRIPEADFHLVGGNDEEIAHWREQRNPENVRFHGFLPPSALPAAFGHFDMVLAPYQARISPSGYRRRAPGEADIGRWISPMKIFEYMAHGMPMIVSDLPTLTEVLCDGETALVCAPTDPGGWEAAVRRLVAEPALGRRLGDAARADFARNYSWSARASRVLDALTERVDAAA